MWTVSQSPGAWGGLGRHQHKEHANEEDARLNPLERGGLGRPTATRGTDPSLKTILSRKNVGLGRGYGQGEPSSELPNVQGCADQRQGPPGGVKHSALPSRLGLSSAPLARYADTFDNLPLA